MKKISNEEKILQRENREQQEYLMDRAKAEVEAVNKNLWPAFRDLGIPLTDELFKDIMYNNSEKIHELYIKGIENGIKSFKTPTIKEKIIKDAEGTWYILKTRISLIDSLFYRRYMSISKGACVISDKNEEAIRDTARTYLTTPEQVAKWNELQQIAKALNNLFTGQAREQLYWWTTFKRIDGNFIVNENIEINLFLNSKHHE